MMAPSVEVGRPIVGATKLVLKYISCEYACGVPLLVPCASSDHQDTSEGVDADSEAKDTRISPGPPKARCTCSEHAPPPERKAAHWVLGTQRSSASGEEDGRKYAEVIRYYAM